MIDKDNGIIDTGVENVCTTAYNYCSKCQDKAWKSGKGKPKMIFAKKYLIHLEILNHNFSNTNHLCSTDFSTPYTRPQRLMHLTTWTVNVILFRRKWRRPEKRTTPSTLLQNMKNDSDTNYQIICNKIGTSSKQRSAPIPHIIQSPYSALLVNSKSTGIRQVVGTVPCRYSQSQSIKWDSR